MAEGEAPTPFRPSGSYVPVADIVSVAEVEGIVAVKVNTPLVFTRVRIGKVPLNVVCATNPSTIIGVPTMRAGPEVTV
jgi:hypothetical protein